MKIEWTLHEVRNAVAQGESSAVDICRTCLDRIKARDEKLHAFTTVSSERALSCAEQIDRTRTIDTDARPLLGVPIAIKDNICTRDITTTASSRILENFIPPYDATVITKLKRAGAVLLGKTNCDEFAMGSSTEHSAFGVTRNPWALDRIPGGSSGGSAVAVAARMVPAALGSDTGGSVRQPAALSGITGLKPTYGRVSRFGLLAFASSLDQIGPLTCTVRDAAILLNVIAGPDSYDSTISLQDVPDFTKALTGDIRGARIGVPRKILNKGVDEDVNRAFFEALGVLDARGATLVDIELPHADSAIPVYSLIAAAEASSNLARYDGVRYAYRASLSENETTIATMYNQTRNRGFGSEVKRRIMLGTYALSAGYHDAYYLKAQQVRTLIRRDYELAFNKVDVVATPTTPLAAFRLGTHVNDPLQMYLIDVFTVSANLTGLPALSVPCGFTSAKLPTGLQLTGRPFDEATPLRLADAYERDEPWWKELPLDLK